MIIMNVGSKYVDFGFSKGQEQALRNGLARELIIFAVVFMATRDIIVAILLTAAFTLLSSVLFHEDSSYCVAPDYLRGMEKLKSVLDGNKDGAVSPEEERRAIEVLELAEKNRRNNLQGHFMNYLQASLA